MYLTALSKTQIESDTLVNSQQTEHFNKMGIRLFVGLTKITLCDIPKQLGAPKHCITQKTCSPTGVHNSFEDNRQYGYTNMQGQSTSIQSFLNLNCIGDTCSNPNNYATGVPSCTHLHVLSIMANSSVRVTLSASGTNPSSIAQFTTETVGVISDMTARLCAAA